MRVRPSSSFRRARFEQLESRAMLAVTVGLDSLGNLSIVGNAEDDEVFVVVAGDNQVYVNDNPTPYQVTGNVNVNLRGGNDYLEISGNFNEGPPILAGNVTIAMGAGTDVVAILLVEINGDLTISNGGVASAGDVEYVGIYEAVVNGHASIDVRGSGSDVVELIGVEFNRSLTVHTGAEFDVLYLNDARVADDFFAHLGAGDDTFTWASSTPGTEPHVGGNATIIGGAGNDAIHFNGLSEELITIAGDLTVQTGNGDDVIYLELLQVNGATTVTGGVGNETVDALLAVFNDDVTISLGGGSDYVALIASEFYANLTITGGAGDETVRGEQSAFYGDVAIKLGAGADSVAIFGSSFAGLVTINGGAGEEWITIEQSTFDDDVSIATGAGDDSVALIDSLFAGDLTLVGGAGFDSLDLTGTEILGTLSVKTFEWQI